MQEQIKTILDAIGSSPDDVVGSAKDDTCCCPAQILADMLTANEDVATRRLSLVEKQREEIADLNTRVAELGTRLDAAILTSDTWESGARYFSSALSDSNGKVVEMVIDSAEKDKRNVISRKKQTDEIHDMREKLYKSRLHVLDLLKTNDTLSKETHDLEAHLAEHVGYVVSVDPAIAEQKQRNEVFARIVQRITDWRHCDIDYRVSYEDMKSISKILNEYHTCYPEAGHGI